jgi:hypothetical protein
MRKFSMLLYAIIGVMSIGITAHASVVYIDAIINGDANPIIQSFGAGTYDVEPIAGGWWTGLSWSNKYRINSTEFSEISVGTSGWPSAEVALINAVGTSFYLSQTADVKFYVHDSKYTDNYGGMTLNVTPIPPSLWLLGSGLIGIVGIRRKFKK